jgi:hypothetical protein
MLSRLAAMYGAANNNKGAYRMFACAYALAAVILLWLHVIVKHDDRCKVIADVVIPDAGTSTDILVDTI